MAGQRFEYIGEVAKTDDALGVVYGYAIVSKIDGEPYADLQGHHIPEREMVAKSLDFAENSGRSGDMHRNVDDGTVPFLFPLTTEIAKSLGIESARTGLLIGMKPSPAVYAKFKSGEYKQFSIGGELL